MKSHADCRELLSRIAKTHCDSTIGKLDLESDEERFGSLMTLGYLFNLFYDEIHEAIN